MVALSLTEEMFAIIQGLSYSESMKFVSLGVVYQKVCLIAWNSRSIMS